MESITFDHARMLMDGHSKTANCKAAAVHQSFSSSTSSSCSHSSSSKSVCLSGHHSFKPLPFETELYPLTDGQRSKTPEAVSKSILVKDENIPNETLSTEVKISGEYLEDVDPELKGLSWNAQEASATYVGRSIWHIPPALSLRYGVRIRKLDLSYNCLRTLTGIEYFNGLEELILDNNLLDDTIRFFYNPYLKTLSINKNKITDLERFLNEISLKLPELIYLSMLGNPACPDQLSSSEHDENDYRRYRSYVVHRIPQLRFLDSSPVKERERIEAQKRGHYYRLIRLNSDSQLFEKNRYRTSSENEVNLPAPPIRTNKLTPLPHKDTNDIQPKGGFGRLRHRYTGKHSEGNRFIKNHEL